MHLLTVLADVGIARLNHSVRRRIAGLRLPLQLQVSINSAFGRCALSNASSRL